MKEAAKKALANNATGAAACAFAIRELFGENWLLWEPETLWIELSKQSVDVPIGNRNQVMAARILINTGRSWYDANVFEKTCIAFNNEEINPDGLEAAPVAYMAWAALEAELILSYHDTLHEKEYDREPVEYVAVQLFREGFVVPPLELNWSDEALAKHYPKERKELRAEVRKAWATAPSSDKLKGAAFPETPAGVQLARLATVQLYLDKRKQAYLKDMSLLAE